MQLDTLIHREKNITVTIIKIVSNNRQVVHINLRESLSCLY